MKSARLPMILLVAILAGCQDDTKPKSESVPVSDQWQPSILTADTIAKANGAVKAYEKCLNDEALAQAGERIDPRAIGDKVLKACEPRLADIKVAFDAEKVPDALSQRYMQKTRSRGAQSLMRFLQTVQAQRSAAEAENSHP